MLHLRRLTVLAHAFHCARNSPRRDASEGVVDRRDPFIGNRIRKLHKIVKLGQFDLTGIFTTTQKCCFWVRAEETSRLRYTFTCLRSSSICTRL